MRKVEHRQQADEQLLKLNVALEERVEQWMAELKEAHRRKYEFLSTMAHERPNPFATMRNAL